MLMIRFQRTGRTNDPAFRISVLEKERAAQAGNIVELLGTYNPKTKALTLNEEHVKEWLAKGAQPTDSIRNLLINKGVIEGKKINVLPKKTPQKNEKKIAEEAAVAEAAAKAVVAAQAAKDAEAAAKVAEEAAIAAAAAVEAPAVEEAAPEVVEAPSEAEVEAEAEAAPVEEAAPAEPVAEEEKAA